MTIHPQRIEVEGDNVIVSAKIEFEKTTAGFQDSLWFKFPAKYEGFVSKNLNGFLVCLLPLAMSLGEDVEVLGDIDDQLIYNLEKYQQLLNFWHPNFSIVKIRTAGRATNAVRKTEVTLSAFSGGVDSFYTLLTHSAPKETRKKLQVTHTLFVQGFDRPLNEERTFQVLSQSYKQLMGSLGLEMILASTNAKAFYQNANWDLCHDAVLVGVAMTLDGLVSRFYFPADDVLPANSDAAGLEYYTYTLGCLKVPLLSSDTFLTVYDGAYTPRIEKLRSISEWQETYERLIVCWGLHDGLKNCGSCEKCIRTMIGLEIFDSLTKYKTFPPLTKSLIRSSDINEELFFYHEWNIKYALRAGKYNLARNLRYALLKNRFYSFIRSFLPRQISNFHKKKG